MRCLVGNDMKSISFRKINKKVIIIGIMVLIVALIFSNINPSFSTTRMPGVEKLIGDISSSPGTESYSILEIVPEEGMGEIGYSISDGPSEYFDTELINAMENESLLETPDYVNARSLAYEQLLNEIQSRRICAPNGATDTTEYEIFRTSTEPYEETYFIESAEADWHRMSIPEELRTNISARGEYQLVGDSQGHYALALDGTGNETIVGFRLADTAEQGMYKLTFGTLEDVTDSRPDNLAYGGYSLIDINETPLDETDDIYVRTSVDAESTELSYILNAEKKGIDSDPEEFVYVPIYSYSYSSNGNYDFIESDDLDASVHSIETGELYYNLNITSNEWFKKKVFELEVNTETYNNFNIDATTYTPGELTEAYASDENLIDRYDFLYVYGDNDITYSSITNDISYEILTKLMDRIYNDDLATVINNNVFYNSVVNDTNSINDSYVYKLSVMAMLNEFEAPLGEPNETEWSDNYADLFMTNYGSYFTEANGSFIVNNAYSHGSYYSLASDYLFDKDFDTPMDGSIHSITTPYQDMINFITDENLIRDVDNQLSTDISTNTIIQYIISVNELSKLELKSKIKILDIEPAKSTGLTKDTVKSWETSLGYEDDDIEIVTMTSSEFIGKIESIKEEYDLVYLGLDTGNLNTVTVDQELETVYNDSNLDGKIYLHTGDATFAQRRLLGMLDEYDEGESLRDSHDYYYSSWNRDVVVLRTMYYEFYEEVDEMNDNIGVFRYSGNDITKKKAEELIEFAEEGYPLVLDEKFQNNLKYLDQSSNIQYFYENVTGALSKDSVFIESDLNGDNEDFKRYLIKPKVVLNLFNEADLDSPNVIDDAELTFEFSIDNDLEFSSEIRYSVNLYFDLNADGRYSEDSEKQSELIYKDSNGDTLEPDVNGEYLLRSNTNYTLIKKLPTTYSGPITWKIVACVVDDTGCDSIANTSEVIPLVANDQNNIVKILQIKSSSSTNNLDLANLLADGTSWHEKIEEDGYDIRVTSITVEQYQNNYEDYLSENNEYDMLILGFADCWGEITSEDAVAAIKVYMDSEKSVLFTHDTLSYVNYINGTYPEDNNINWGYQFNSLLRNSFGMDRYGVSERDDDDYSDMGKSLRKGEVISNPNGVLENANDIAYIVDNFSKSYPEVRGYSNTLLDDSKVSGLNYYNLDDSGINGPSFGNNNYQMYINQINSGQITKFPYDLENDEGSINISPTHYQYYQLDMESTDENGESDIVVWYTIGGLKDWQGDHVATPYSASPNDVRNNYYIYSKGNIMYSGAGHSTVNSEQEIKLFLNTMIAAYRIGNQDPILSIQNDRDINSGEKGAICFAYDDITDTDEIPINGSDELYFNVNNPNLMATDNSFTVTYEYQLDDGSYDRILASTSLVTSEGMIPISNSDIVSGNVYKMVLPLGSKLYDYLGEDGMGRLKIKINYSYNLYGDNMQGSKAKEVMLTKMNLYNLQ